MKIGKTSTSAEKACAEPLADRAVRRRCRGKGAAEHVGDLDDPPRRLALGIALALLVTAGPYWYLNTIGFDLMAAMTDGQGAEVAGVALTSRMYVDIYPENALMIGGAALCATLLSGIYPAWKAGHVDPAETIRLV